MGNLFNPDNKFFRVMGKIWDMFVISIYWVICCLPLYFVVSVVTSVYTDIVQVLLYMLMNAALMIPVGPAMCAIYYVSVKVIRRDRGYVTREYFRAFKMNFKVGAVSAAIMGALVTLLSFNMQVSYKAALLGESNGDIMLGITIAVLLILSCVFVMLFPILSRFTFGVGQLFKSTIFIAFRNIIYTIPTVVIVAVSAYALLALAPAIFFVPALCAFLISYPVETVLKKYMPKPEETVAPDGDLVHEGDVITQEEQKKDLWYWE